MTLAVMAVCVAAASPCGGQCQDGRLPSELCAVEVRSDFGMVSTGSSEATRAAVDVLERGGNAIDAAVAASLVLSVVDSDASGIGGMTYMVIHLADGRTVAVDGTSYAPLAIDIERFREFKASGRTYGYETISTPTTLATLEHARGRYGTMAMADLLEPAIEVAEHGYPLSEIQITWTRKYHDNILAASDYMALLAMEDGRTIGSPGDLQCQPDVARTLRRIAREGVGSFYIGPIAAEIEADMIRGGGFLRRWDLAHVRVREVPPLHTTYRGFDIYTFPPPGGGTGVVTTLNTLEAFPADFLAQDSSERHQVVVETFRIAAADARLANSQMSSFGSDVLTSSHARARAAQIIPGTRLPDSVLATPVDPGCDPPGESTTQVSVADSLGNAVSLTQTLSRSFGAKIATPGLGFPYNSFLEAFNADKPQCPGYLQPNSPCTSDMAPTIVLKDGSFFAALGTPGSNRIPKVIALVISNMVDRKLGVGEAVTAPRVLWGGMEYLRVYIEVVDPITESDVAAFEDMGYQNMTILHYPAPPDDTKAKFGGVNAVAYDASTGVFTGIGDPRRGGSAMGPRVVAESGRDR